MLAYHVCECTRSVPAQASAIARSTPSVRSAALAEARAPGSAYDAVPCSSRGAPNACTRVVEVLAAPQRPHQLGHVDAGTAVDLGRVLLGQHVDAHGVDVTAPGGRGARASE